MLQVKNQIYDYKLAAFFEDKSRPFGKMLINISRVKNLKDMYFKKVIINIRENNFVVCMPLYLDG